MVSNADSNGQVSQTHLCQGLRPTESQTDRCEAKCFRSREREVVYCFVCRHGTTRDFLIKQHYKHIRVCQQEGKRRRPKRDGYPAPENDTTNQPAAHPAGRFNAQKGVDEALVVKTLLTIPAVAEELKVSRSTVYRLISARELPTVQVRGCRRVTRTALDRYITGLERSARLADVVISYDE